MAYSFPSTVSTGDVLAASTWNQAIRENQKFGMATFTTEAARDASITSPEEGMRAYLTAPTVPAATGGTTAIPTGITTVYNGSVWVCTTAVSAYTSNAGTTTSTSYTATLSGSPGTNPSVTLVTGTTALVTVASLLYGTTAGNVYASVAVSGAGTVAAADGYAAYTGTTAGIVSCKTFVLSGLTAGTNTFTINYKAGAYTGNYQDRQLVVQGVA